MISNFRYHFNQKMMLSTSEPSSWDPQHLNQQELYSILVLNILPSHQFSVMMRQPVTISSRNTIHCQVVLLLEIKCIKDVKLWHMICINQILIRFYQKHPQSLLMDQPNFKVSFGKTIHAFNH